MSRTVRCGNPACAAQPVIEPDDASLAAELRPPCPVCGSQARAVSVVAQDSALQKEQTILSPEQIRALADAVPRRYRALIITAAGTGSRQGKILGLSVDRADFLRKTPRVDRQILLDSRGARVFGPPKTRAGNRTVPVPQVVIEALSQHLAEFPAGPGWPYLHGPQGSPARAQPLP